MTSAFTFGSLHGAYHILKVIVIRNEAFQKSHEVSIKAFEIVNLFIETKIQQPDWECPISKELMAFPVVINCGHIFELLSLALMITWARPPQSASPTACPLCRKSIFYIEHRKRSSDNIHQIAHKIFEKIEMLLNQSHILDDLTTGEIHEATQR
ncbi:MAG: hypothetical protein QRY71_04465 [Candidatus Rhabdochlamydia sp.]